VAVLVIMAGCSGSGPSPSPRSASPGSVSTGQVVFATYCASCHGDNGEGKSACGLVDQEFLKLRDDAYFYRLISDGMPNRCMPSFAKEKGGPLSDSEIASLTSFIRSWEK